MAKVGYIFNSEQYDTFTFDRAWMEKYGCCRIIEDCASQEKTRPEWKQLMDCLKRGDELVISKFSNALRGVRELAMFLEFCRVKVIRIISIQDKIDSKGELFPSTSIADVLFMFGSLSEEIVALRKAATHVEYIKSGIKPAKSSTPKKALTVRGISSICITTTTLSMTSGRSAASGAAARCSAYSTNMG